MSILITEPGTIARLQSALDWAYGEWHAVGGGNIHLTFARNWDQGDWDQCLASQIVLDQQGWELAGDGGTAVHTDSEDGEADREANIEDIAWELLGFPFPTHLTHSKATALAERDLFAGDNSIIELFAIAAAYTDGVITIPTDLVEPASV